MLTEHFGFKSSGLIYVKEGISENSLIVRKSNLSGIRYLHKADLFFFAGLLQ